MGLRTAFMVTPKQDIKNHCGGSTHLTAQWVSAVRKQDRQGDLLSEPRSPADGVSFWRAATLLGQPRILYACGKGRIDALPQGTPALCSTQEAPQDRLTAGVCACVPPREISVP